MFPRLQSASADEVVSDAVRAFFAIELPADARARAAEAVERLKSVARAACAGWRSTRCT